jgi:hypothetical protein
MFCSESRGCTQHRTTQVSMLNFCVGRAHQIVSKCGARVIQEFDLANNGVRQESKAVSGRLLMYGRLHWQRQTTVFLITIKRQQVPVGICSGYRPRAAYGRSFGNIPVLSTMVFMCIIPLLRTYQFVWLADYVLSK